MIFKKTQLVQILGCSQATEDKWIDPINAACEKFSINTRLRLAAFIAQVGHESGNLSTLTENLSYSADGLMKTWPARFDAAKAAECARKPEKIANVVYSSRMGNGSEASGEGWMYRGRGLIQCTGKANYDAFSQACGINAVANPDSLTQPTNAALSAGWFWSSKGLNAYADRQDFLTITKRINGGTTGQAERERLYKKALIVLSDETPPTDDKLDEQSPKDMPEKVTTPVSEEKTPAAKNSSIVEPRSASGDPAKYPWNFVTESRSGHYTEIDDSPGDERIKMAHRTGSYWEIGPTGTLTLKSVLDVYRLAKGDTYDYTGGNFTQQVKGDTFIQGSGNIAIKTGAQIYANASKMQFNTGMLSVSGEVNAPSVNANRFGGMGGLAFGDMLAKESLVAYSLKKGSAPMISGSLGFKGGGGVEGSADSLMSNTLSSKAPDGTPWITNGVASLASAVVAAGAIAAGAGIVSGILKGNDVDPATQNALNSAGADMDAAEIAEAAQTPVFLKHVTFDKPTLLSMSTRADLPDPALYVNNYHTIVNSFGVGQLHISNGSEWIPIGDISNALAYTDQVALNTVTGLQADIANEAVARGQALADEARARSMEIQQEALDRQNAIDQGILAEAVQRGAAITAEAEARQSADDSFTTYLLNLTAAVDDNAAAISLEQTARVDAVTAEASERLALASKIDDNTATIQQEIITRATSDSAFTSKLDELTATTGANQATVTTQISTLTDNISAQGATLDALTVKTDANAAAIITESNARVDDVSSLSSRLDAVLATTASTQAAVVSESTARADADTANANYIQTVSAAVTVAQGDASSALSQISNISSDNMLSRSEKSAVIQEYATLVNEKTPLETQATAFGITTEKTDYTAAITSLTAYITGLTPPYNDFSQDTPITGDTFRSKFTDVYAKRVTLMNAIDLKAKQLADNAQTDATAANTQIGNISSDNVLSMGEKSQVIVNYLSLTNEQASIEAQADAFVVSKTSYVNAMTALKTYITGLSPAYSDTTQHTTIVGSTFRTKFTDVYTARQNLLNAIDTKAKAIGDSKAKVTRSSTAPTGPTVGDIWIDISDTKNVSKVWDGATWQDTDWRTSQNAADIITERNARSDAVSAVATSVDTVSSRLNNGNSAPFEPYQLWDFNTTVDGCTVAGATITWKAGGYVALVSTSTDPIFRTPSGLTIPGSLNDKVRAKVRRTGGNIASWDGTLYYSTSGHGESGTYSKQIPSPSVTEFASWWILEWDMSAITDWTTNTITQIRIDMGMVSGDNFDIDWVAVGKRGVGVPTASFATVQTQASTAVTDTGNIKAQWGIKTNANGVITGIAVQSDLIAGNATSTVKVQADKFEITPSVATGARMELSAQVMKIYDSSGTLRVKLGVW